MKNVPLSRRRIGRRNDICKTQKALLGGANSAPPRAVVVSGPRFDEPRDTFTPSGAQSITGPTLRLGHRGEEVRRLQRLLRAQGMDLSVDGVMGPQTLTAVRQFQKQRGLSVDGIVGKNTWDAFSGSDQNRPPRAIPVALKVATPKPSRFTGPISHPSGATAEQAEAHYKGLLERHGVKAKAGKTYVLGLRGLSPNGDRFSTTDGNSLREANRQGNRYNDSFVVLRPKRNGGHHPYVFQGATYPGQSSSTRSPDANGDKVGDVGMVRPGVFQVRPNGEYYGAASFRVRKLNGSTRLPAWRDLNHDGDYDRPERQRSEARGNSMSGILFHQGDSAAPNSIGCQTLSPSEYQKFLQAVGGERASFTYALIDAGQ